MEITLEKIELVKDRTGVSYREAKEALEASDGNVVDAIIAIEDDINSKGKGPDVKAQTDKIVEKIKYYINKGNVSKISIKKNDEVVMNIPVTIGAAATLLAPWVTIIGAVTAYGTKCTIDLIKDDGTVININEKADDAIEKGGDVFDTVKEKSKDAFGKAKESTENFGDIKDIVKEKGSAIKETVKDGFSDIKDTYKKDEPEVQAEAAAEEPEVSVTPEAPETPKTPETTEAAEGEE
ncbi:MAG: DUF4342 domain-containing protein [Clostridiales Family XIII bacterium]|jgi:gas vesicle protein|nr:DUF4342 domain-containing protein [Clostridiales Family XIII bacterium]